MDDKEIDDQKQVQEKFESLPLNEKISTLFKMEVSTLSEAINYVVKEPMKVAEKFGDLITDLGAKIEHEFGRSADKGPQNQNPTGQNKKKRSRRATEPGTASV